MCKCVIFDTQINLYTDVTETTHNKGHTLDLIISKGLNISKVVVTDVALSDHSCVFFEGSISVHKHFQNNFSSTLAPANISVNELVDHFNSKIKNVIDAIAPTKVKEVTGKKIAPWRKAMTVKTEKREC